MKNDVRRNDALARKTITASRCFPFCIVALLLFSTSAALAGDFDADVEAATKKFRGVMPVLMEKMNAGDFAGSKATLLAGFPPATRTAGESFLLANVLFDMDPKESYALHRAAAKAEPQNPGVAWEWGLEQHRAGEYAGALESYRFFSKAQPGYAVPYALQADCLLHLNRIDEAIEAWHQSEVAPSGSLEAMENMVCSVNREAAPHQRRADLLVRAIATRDFEAAMDLIALDCDFPKDWWNGGPQEQYLTHDTQAIAAALQMPEDVRSRAMACAAECATADHTDPAAINKILAKHRLLIDADHTLPTHGGLLHVILTAAVQAKAIDETVLRQQLGPKLLELAKKGKDAWIWNIAAGIAPPTKPDERMQFERDGWKATGDVHFAAGALFLKAQQAPLAGNDADLAAALKQFPESGVIQRIRYQVALRENNVTRELLADAARAEFRHFSSFMAPATVVDRPRSGYLRQYFAKLAQMSATTKPAVRP